MCNAQTVSFLGNKILRISSICMLNSSQAAIDKGTESQENDMGSWMGKHYTRCTSKTLMTRFSIELSRIWQFLKWGRGWPHLQTLFVSVSDKLPTKIASAKEARKGGCCFASKRKNNLKIFMIFIHTIINMDIVLRIVSNMYVTCH